MTDILIPVGFSHGPICESFTALYHPLLHLRRRPPVAAGVCNVPQTRAGSWPEAARLPHLVKSDGCLFEVRQNCISSISLCGARLNPRSLMDHA